MNKLILPLAILLASLTPLSLPAHPEGHPPIDKATAQQSAVGVVKRMTEKQKLDASWTRIAPGTAELRVHEGRKERVVVFHNPEEKTPSQQTLQVVFTESGFFVAANFVDKQAS